MRAHYLLIPALLAVALSCWAGPEPAKSSPIDSAIDQVKPAGRFKEQERAKLKTEVADILRSRLHNREDIVKYVSKSPPGDVRDALRHMISVGMLESIRKNGHDGPLPKEFEVGREMARQMREEHPQDPRANHDLGAYDYYAKDFKSAADHFDQAYKGGDQSAELLAQYADAALHLGDFETAATAALMALQADPANRDARAVYEFSKGRISKMRLPTSLRTPGAPQEAAQAASAPPSSSAPGLAAIPLGMTAASAGGEARGRSVQLAREAVAAMRVRDYEQAQRLAGQAIALNPANAQAFNYRAMALSQMERYAQATDDANAALQLAPGNPAALHTRSWVFSKRGRYREALDDARAAISADPANAILYQDEAYALAGLRDRPGVLDALSRSAQLDERFSPRLARATQLPQDADMTLLFDDRAAALPPVPVSPAKRFWRLFAMSASGGLLIALGLLHILSPGWKQAVHATMRRVIGSPQAAPLAEEPLHGSFWTQYELVKEIGLGGMGVVYEAVDRSLERRVAVKKMREEVRRDPDDRRRFIQEARLVAQLHHPHIVDIYGIMEDGSDLYLVFEFVPGRTLADTLKADGPLALRRAIAVVRDMAEAVAHAHERGIIHRDLKPSNVMLTPEGRVKVMDFGVARQAKDTVTRQSASAIVGTPAYMAPEQEQGQVRRESDIYALGVCLYEMATGQLPFAGYGAAMMLNKLNGRHIPPSQRSRNFSVEFDQMIARALIPDPDKRYRTPGEFIAALEAFTA